ncbi:MAG: LD-carboxypeptidase [Neisseriaceae bacterium]|nr:LD-carboxypeptidase [Neisseriaceae bacterium]
MNKNPKISRRQLLAAATGSAILTACQAVPEVPVAVPDETNERKIIVNPDSYNSVHLFASSGYAQDHSRIELGINRLSQAGFALANINAAYRRYQRFAGSDSERANDLIPIANGALPTPKMLLGLRGGYGAMRFLPDINWASLGDRMRERGTLLFGFSDVCAIQLALLAQGKMMSFAGPMLYSEFGRPQAPEYTFQSFVNGMSNDTITVDVPSFTGKPLNLEGVFWGGNLSVLVSLIGTPYFPQIDGGILFLEDVGEQPYRLDRMFQQLAMSGCLKKQQAIVLGNFRMNSKNTDIYDASYDLPTVIADLRRVANIPVLLDFPFGHIVNKTTFPLGAVAKLTSNGERYTVAFSGYPRLEPERLNLSSLLPYQGSVTGGLWEDDSGVYVE